MDNLLVFCIIPFYFAHRWSNKGGYDIEEINLSIGFTSILLVACGKNAEPKEVAVDQNTNVEDIVGAIVKNEFSVEESKDGVVTISIQDTDVTEGSKSQMLKDSTKIFADLSKLKA